MSSLPTIDSFSFFGELGKPVETPTTQQEPLSSDDPEPTSLPGCHQSFPDSPSVEALRRKAAASRRRDSSPPQGTTIRDTVHATPLDAPSRSPTQQLVDQLPTATATLNQTWFAGDTPQWSWWTSVAPFWSSSQSSLEPILDVPQASFSTAFNRLYLPVSALRAGHTFDDYAPWLFTRTPVDPARSVSYIYAQMRFLQFCSPPSRWAHRPAGAAFRPPTFPPTMLQAMELQPDFGNIPLAFPLGTAPPPPEREIASNAAQWRSMLATVKWIWGAAPKPWANVAWVVQHVPDALFCLLRHYAAQQLYSRASQHAWRECSSFLLSPFRLDTPAYTPHEQRARILLKWLDDGGEARKMRFFLDAHGRAVKPGGGGVNGTEEVWEWWFEDLGRERDIEELDDWERRGLASGARAR
ncbi:hypothetical protein JCM8097_009085 [Rhodosporidiobolus ruineniae]